MRDHDEIERLINLYGHIVDDRDWDRLDELFAPDGSFIIDICLSRAGDLTRLRHGSRTTNHPIAHYATNIVIDVAEGADEAQAG